MFNAAFYPGAALTCVSTGDIPVNHAFFSQALKAECPAQAPGLIPISHAAGEVVGTTLAVKVRPVERAVA